MTIPADPVLPVSTVPPTVIVVHPRERRSKCSVESLRDRDGFVFCTFPNPVPIDITGYVQGERSAGRNLISLG